MKNNMRFVSRGKKGSSSPTFGGVKNEEASESKVESRNEDETNEGTSLHDLAPKQHKGFHIMISIGKHPGSKF